MVRINVKTIGKAWKKLYGFHLCAERSMVACTLIIDERKLIIEISNAK
jgi:hypothetical protein